MLSADELARIRSDLAGLLPDTCNLLAGTAAPDGFGGQTITWGTASASVACRKDYERGAKILSGEAQQIFTGWMFSLPYNTTVTETTRIEHGGKTYTIKGQDSGKSWNAVLRVAAEEI
jgi:hypothetical protein